jgi:hypothetical protein
MAAQDCWGAGVPWRVGAQRLISLRLGGSEGPESRGVCGSNVTQGTLPW